MNATELKNTLVSKEAGEYVYQVGSTKYIIKKNSTNWQIDTYNENGSLVDSYGYIGYTMMDAKDSIMMNH